MKMVEVKTAELIGYALDWAVSSVVHKQGICCAEFEEIKSIETLKCAGLVRKYSTDWGQIGPLIEKYKVSLEVRPSGQWDAYCDRWVLFCESPLTAVCRAIVAAKLGDVVSVPAELVNGGGV